MRTISLTFGVLVFFGLGIRPVPAELFPPDPTWKRLGLPESPTLESGRGVGVVMIDDGTLHSGLRHLGDRLKHVVIDKDRQVTLVEPLTNHKFTAQENAEHSHGVRSLLQMAAAPFQVQGQSYIGLVPGATYFVVTDDGTDARRLERAIEWVVDDRQRWNIRVILNSGWQIPAPADSRLDCLIRNTKDYPRVRALKKAVEAGILVVAGNGNSSAINNLPPADYLAVGAYHDAGHADLRFHRENSDEPWGRNGDGHDRPDLLAPIFLVPNRRTAAGELAYFGGTSSGGAQVAALCALLFARFPEADAPTMKYAMIRAGDPLPGSRRPGVRVNAARAIAMLKQHSIRPPWPELPPPITVDEPNSSLDSPDAVERALAVSALASHPEQFRPKAGEPLRLVFWRSLGDDSHTVRMAAASALHGPESKEERLRLWNAFRREPHLGVRGQLALLLLAGAKSDRLDDWIPLATDPNFTVRWCVIRAIRKLAPGAPAPELAYQPEDVEIKAAPILEWYRNQNPTRAK